MCWFKKVIVEKPEGVMTKAQLISECENGASIHLYWADRVKSEPELAEVMGDEDWHFHWVKVYEDLTWWLKN